MERHINKNTKLSNEALFEIVNIIDEEHKLRHFIKGFASGWLACLFICSIIFTTIHIWSML